MFEGFEKLYSRGQMVSLAYEIKDRISEELGFMVNVGVSMNFLLSKTAEDFSKPDKVHTHTPTITASPLVNQEEAELKIQFSRRSEVKNARCSIVIRLAVCYNFSIIVSSTF